MEWSGGRRQRSWLLRWGGWDVRDEEKRQVKLLVRLDKPIFTACASNEATTLRKRAGVGRKNVCDGPLRRVC